MAIVAHLVERTFTDGDNDLRDGIRAALVAINDATDTTAALIRVRAAILARANGLDIPDNYFNANRLVLTTWDNALDITIFGNGGTVFEVIA